MRLFVAAELPGEVRSRLAAAAPGPPWRAVAEDALHVTLAFLGERAEADVAVIGDALDACVGARVAAELGGMVLLPPRRPRVCAVRVASAGLEALQARVAGALVEAGVHRAEVRPFLPHVTLARIRERPPPTSVAVDGAFAFGSMALYESRPRPGGSRYTALHRATLHA